MRSRELDSGAGDRTHILVFETDDEVMSGLLDFASQAGVTAAHFTAIGAFSNAVLAWFDWEKKDYRKILIREQVEVLMLGGDIALKDGEPQVHAHVVLGKSDGTAHGGHLMEAHVRPTLEVILTETPARLRRQVDAQSGLALIAV